jgi:ubiquinone/menaquinone biosynthesis C-methylase UbiE
MSIFFAPPMGKWFLSQVLDLIPIYNKFRIKNRNKKTFELAKKSANLNFSFKIIDSGWAIKNFFSHKNFKILTKELLEIDKNFGIKLVGGIPSSLHWSRRYEYPYTIINSNLPEKSQKKIRILDCGAGIGPLQFYFANKGYKYYSLDQNLWALSRVAQFKSDKKIKNLYAIYGNILDLPFPNNYFHRVFCISTLEHIVEPLTKNIEIILKGFANELLRVLKPEGLLILTFDVNMSPEKSTKRLTPNEYEKMCEILGIEIDTPTQNRLYSTETKEGKIMGTDLSVYCVTLKLCNIN